MAVPADHPDIRDMRFERNVAQLHQLGDRAMCELLREIGASTMHMTTVEKVVERYAAMDPDMVRAVGADVFPPRPSLRIVRGGRHAS